MQANLLAATTTDAAAIGQVYNVAAGGRMSLNELCAILRDLTVEHRPDVCVPPPVYQAFRAGDVRHSQADIAKAQRLLGYAPAYDARAGLAEALPWYDARSRGASRERIRANGTGRA